MEIEFQKFTAVTEVVTGTAAAWAGGAAGCGRERFTRVRVRHLVLPGQTPNEESGREMG